MNATNYNATCGESYVSTKVIEFLADVGAYHNSLNAAVANGAGSSVSSDLVEAAVTGQQNTFWSKFVILTNRNTNNVVRIAEAQNIAQIPYSWDTTFTAVEKWNTPWRAFFAYANGSLNIFYVIVCRKLSVDSLLMLQFCCFLFINYNYWNKLITLFNFFYIK